MMRFSSLICCVIIALFSAAFSQDDMHERVASLEEKIERGSAKAAYQLAHLYVKEKRDIEAEQWLQHAAVLGYAPAAIELARYYEQGRFAAEEGAAQAIQEYGLALMAYGDKTGDAESLFALGEYYLAKQGEQHIERGKTYLERAAYAGHKDAMLRMAQRAFETSHAQKVTPHTPAEALYWLRSAAKKGSSKAWVMLAEFYLGSDGVTQNVMRAKEAIEQARLLGHPRAATLASSLEALVATAGSADAE